MSDKVYPNSAKPAAATTTGANPPPPAAKSHLFNPTARPPYRPQPYPRRRRRSGRSICCCCCFWSILLLLLLLLAASIAGCAAYVLYRPHRPEFSVPSLRLHRLNLTTSADSATAHLSSLLNFTVLSKNPNAHVKFSYDSFSISAFSGGVFLGNGTLPAHELGTKNQTSFRNVVVSGAGELDSESVSSLRSDLKRKNGAIQLKILFDTKVKVKIGGLKTKKVGIRVSCDGIKGNVPKGKSPAAAVTSSAKCKVDLRIKIWKFTF